MKSIRALGLCCLLPLVCPSAMGQTLEWIQQWGSPQDDVGSGVSADAFGNVYVTGSTSPPQDPETGFNRDTLLLKYNSAGDLQWSRTADFGGHEDTKAVATDAAGNVYQAGRISVGQGGLLNKYSSNGVLLWTRRFDQDAFGVATDVVGNVYTTGYGRNESRTGDDNDAFLVKHDPQGGEQWTRWLGTEANDLGYAVATDLLGSLYIAGSTRGDLGGANAGGSDAFVAKYSVDGALLWSHQFGTLASDIGRAVATDVLGNVYVTGTTSGLLAEEAVGGADGFLVKLDPEGTPLWERQFGSVLLDTPYGLSVDTAGGVYVAGSTHGGLEGANAGAIGGNPASQNDAFLLKFDTSGHRLWSRQFGTADLDKVNAVTVDAAGLVYVAGDTRGDLAAPNSGRDDVFLARFYGDLTGDFNQNGAVDAADYTVWRDGLGTTHTPEGYADWRDHYGDTTAGRPPVDPPPAPEPEVKAWVIQAKVVEIIDPDGVLSAVQLNDNVTGELRYDLSTAGTAIGENVSAYTHAQPFHTVAMTVNATSGNDPTFSALPLKSDVLVGNDEPLHELGGSVELDYLFASQPVFPLGLGSNVTDSAVIVSLSALELFNKPTLPTVLNLSDWDEALIGYTHVSSAGTTFLVAQITGLTPIQIASNSQPVPEPAAWLMFCVAVGSWLTLRRRLAAVSSGERRSPVSPVPVRPC
ncbi:Beta-propeller repeat protein [Pirellulimonas nuda]|uniref:Beta-propeller repeat protein n=1 Tax=Pirellulimonas nuda TaxID=2528009 RepID=A0A518DDB1_9BACT|nr:SBBP repeat-containing protein [Pirellulimonas nuda]QDU89475.1 Beta-propeller repeat protein [Pirellulimonas nuda]